MRSVNVELRTYLYIIIIFITDIKEINLTLLEYSWVKSSFVYYVLCILLTVGYILLFPLYSEENFCYGAFRSYRLKL
jgi:hypothetical protein